MCFDSKFFLFVFSSYPVQIPISVSNVLAEFFRFFFSVFPGKLRDSTSFTWRSVCSLPLQYITRRSSHDLTRSYRSYRQQRRQLNKFNVLESTRDDKSFWTDDNKKISYFFWSYALFAPFPLQFLSYKHPSCLNDRQMEAKPNEKSTNNIAKCLKKIIAKACQEEPGAT